MTSSNKLSCKVFYVLFILSLFFEDFSGLNSHKNNAINNIIKNEKF